MFAKVILYIVHPKFQKKKKHYIFFGIVIDPNYLKGQHQYGVVFGCLNLIFFPWDNDKTLFL